MRQALNNPWVVGFLCLAALGLFFNNVFQPLFADSESREVPREPAPLRVLSVHNPPEDEPKKPDLKKVRWIENPSRDPFR